MTLEADFWEGLKEIAGGRRMTLSELVGAIDAQRQHGNLSSALRLSCWSTIAAKQRSRITKFLASNRHITFLSPRGQAGAPDMLEGVRNDVSTHAPRCGVGSHMRTPMPHH